LVWNTLKLIKVFIPKVKMRKFKPRIRTWKLKDPAIASRFCDAFRTNMTRAAAENNCRNAVENAWSKLKDPLLCAATVVCGLSKNHQWRPETWWWNDRVASRFCDAFRTNMTRAAAENNWQRGGECVVEAERPSTVHCHCGVWPFQEPPVESRNLVVEWQCWGCCQRETDTLYSIQCTKEGR